jgi:phenylpropionate dioxygenase-like ring-hydroxylating dioxygenase large terminal subunit
VITQKENQLLTDILPGTAAGDLVRRYWQPAALVDEMRAERPLVPVTLMGERLVLFRDEQGRYGLMERQCPHRGADLCFGRLEDGGLRCAFHGWLFDVTGQCLEQPAEPTGSRSHQHLKHRAYPCQERNGIVFAYLGAGSPPPLGEFDCFTAPSEYTFAFKGLIECNWLQAVEVGIDPAHASFLHRFLEDEPPDAAYGKQFRGTGNTGVPLTRVLREHQRPEISVQEIDYGLRIITTRDIDSAQRHYRVTNLVFPNAIVIPMSDEMTITQWHVPIDNHSCYWYAIFTSFGAPVEKERMREQRLALYELPEYRPRVNRSNDYGFSAEEQKTQTYTGMGTDINVHDQWAVESMGAIQDRTREHLGKSDVAIVRFRKILKSAIESGRPPEPIHANPVAVDLIGECANHDCWMEFDRQRRSRAKWVASRR